MNGRKAKEKRKQEQVQNAGDKNVKILIEVMVLESGEIAVNGPFKTMDINFFRKIMMEADRAVSNFIFTENRKNKIKIVH